MTIAGKILRGIYDVGKVAAGIVTFQPSVSQSAVNDLNNLTGYNQQQSLLTQHLIANENLANSQGLNPDQNKNTAPTSNVLSSISPVWWFIGFLILLFGLSTNNKRKK
jgi:hypothetical protein